jgi:hypothetical protein
MCLEVRTPGGTYDRFVPTKRSRVVDRLLRWSLAAVAAALTPFAFTYFSLWFRNEPRPGVVNLFGRGELLLLAATVAGAGACEAYFAEKTISARSRGIAGGAALLVATISAGGYAIAMTTLMAGDNYSENRVAWTSVWIFVLSLVTAGACIYVEAAGDKDHDDL